MVVRFEHWRFCVGGNLCIIRVYFWEVVIEGVIIKAVLYDLFESMRDLCRKMTTIPVQFAVLKADAFLLALQQA
jgi:hypothetical protein